MKKICSLVVMCGGILFFSSCQQEEVETKAVSTEAENNFEMSVENGILRFNSAETCEKLLATLGNSEKIGSFTKQNSGFRSMFLIYNELISKDIGELIKNGGLTNYEGAFKISVDSNGDKVYDRAILDESIAAIVNKEGLLQIGDTLYKIGEEKTLKMHIRYKNESFTVDNPHVIGKEVIHQTVKMSPPKNAKVSSDHNFADLEYNPGAGFNNRRFRVMGWSTNYSFIQNYWSMGVRINHQRKNWYGWGAYDAQNITLSGDFTMYRYPSPVGAIFNGYVQNSNEIQYRYSETWTASSVGTISCSFNWTAQGDNNWFSGTQSGNWTESI